MQFLLYLWAINVIVIIDSSTYDLITRNQHLFAMKRCQQRRAALSGPWGFRNPTKRTSNPPQGRWIRRPQDCKLPSVRDLARPPLGLIYSTVDKANHGLRGALDQHSSWRLLLRTCFGSQVHVLGAHAVCIAPNMGLTVKKRPPVRQKKR